MTQSRSSTIGWWRGCLVGGGRCVPSLRAALTRSMTWPEPKRSGWRNYVTRTDAVPWPLLVRLYTLLMRRAHYTCGMHATHAACTLHMRYECYTCCMHPSRAACTLHMLHAPFSCGSICSMNAARAACTPHLTCCSFKWCTVPLI